MSRRILIACASFGYLFLALFMLVGAVATAPFVAALPSLIRRIGSRLAPLAAIQLVCGAANVAAIFVPVLIFTATAGGAPVRRRVPRNGPRPGAGRSPRRSLPPERSPR